MADDLTTQESVAPEAAPAASEPLVVSPPGYRPPLYGTRFALAYALLAVLLGGGVGLAVVQFGTDEAKSVAWSKWQPTAEGATPVAKEIADLVSRKYRLPEGGQLVGVVPGQLAVQNVPVDVIATRSGPTNDDKIDVTDARGSLMFVLCGLGERCAIAQGEASTERHRLLRREALELALYAFRHLDGVQRVVAFMPPKAGEEPTAALYFRRQDLERQVKEPLAETLLPLERLTPADIPVGERELVDALTEPRLFNFSFQQSQSGNAVMILDPAV